MSQAAIDQQQRLGFDHFVVPEISVFYRVALSLTGQPADAEDLVQDTLIRAFRAVDRFDGAHPRAWLLTILRHATSTGPVGEGRSCCEMVSRLS